MSQKINGTTRSAGNMKWLGILTIILGILAIMMPYMTGQSVLMFVGVLVMAGGLLRLIWAFKSGNLGKGAMVVLIGLLTLLAGIWILTQPLIVVAAGLLTMGLAGYLFADGLAGIFAAYSLSPGEPGKGWLIFEGVVTITLGVLLFMGFPFSGPLAIGVLLGIKLMFAGISMLKVCS